MSSSVLLIVVDDPAHRMLFNKFLKKTSHHLVFAMDGEDGFDRYAECKPDLILAHVNVARIDGTILCQLIRQQPRGNLTPFVLLSEEFSDSETGRLRMGAVGADAYLTYPFDRSSLAQCITPLLAFGRPEPEPSAKTEYPTPPPDMEQPPVPLSDPGLLAEMSALARDAASLKTEQGQVPLKKEESKTAMEDLEISKDAIEAAQGTEPPLDADTVVTFKNPFFKEGAEPIVGGSDEAVEVTPEVKVSEPSPPSGVAIPTGSEMGQERPTSVEAEPPKDPFEIRLPDSPIVDPAEGSGQNDRVLTQEDSSPGSTPPDNGTSSASQARIQEAVMPLEPRRDPLEEPPISVSGPHPHPGKDVSTGARLIQEPKLEGTPSQSEPAKQLAPAAAVRRGLDESQLGKRLAKRVRTMHRLLDEVDYYQLLGLDREATDEELARVYFDLSLEFHPDRFFLLRSGDLKEKIYGVFRRVTEAFNILSDQERRKRYDEGLESESVKKRAPSELRLIKPHQVEVPNKCAVGVNAKSEEAQHFIQLAEKAYADGNKNDARLRLHLALTHEKQNKELKKAIDDLARETRPTR